MQASQRQATVSIVIPCFNGAEFAADAISSATTQTYPHKEVIVIDDGSTDRTLDVIRSFGKAIRWQSGPHRGAGAARNSAIALARGEFIQFLDADDVLMPECVDRKIVARQKEPAACPCCDWIRVDHLGRNTLAPAVHAVDSVLGTLSGSIQTGSPLHRREDLLRVKGFDAQLPCSQEFDLHLRLACAGVRFRHLAEPLLVVRRRPGSVSHDYTKVLLQHGRVFSRVADILRRQNGLTPLRRVALAKVLAQDGRRLFHRGRKVDARQYWRMAADLDRAGFQAAYGRAPTRRLLRLVGPELTDSFVAALNHFGRAW